MTTLWQELNSLALPTALERVKYLLRNADFSKGDHNLTPEELDACSWAEDRYYAGEISYRQLWATISSRLCRG